MSVFDLPMAHYQVVENQQGDLAIWPVTLVLPQGWQVRFSSDSTVALSQIPLTGASNDAQNDAGHMLSLKGQDAVISQDTRTTHKACCMKFIAEQGSSESNSSTRNVVLNNPQVNLSSSDKNLEVTPLSSLQPAAQGITALFDRYDLVGLSEMHWHSDVIAAFIDLLRADELAAIVDDIVVEFGNAAYQSVVDDYVAGAAVTDAELAQAWRNSLNFVVWQPTGYQQLFKTVRQLNQQRPKNQQLRIVLAEPAFDWRQIKHADDWRVRQTQRDQGYYQRIKSEVLQKGRKGLLIFGGYHLTRQPVVRHRTRQEAAVSAQKTKVLLGEEDISTLGALLAEHQPGRSYMLWTTDITQFDAQKRLLGTLENTENSFPVWPQVIRAEQGWLGAMPFAAISGGHQQQAVANKGQAPQVKQMVEGVLFLSGLQREVKLPDSVLADKAWLKTMWQRTEQLPKGFRQRLQSLLPEAAVTETLQDEARSRASDKPLKKSK
ncbi:MbtH family NRPS accessory protein [Zooshikella harenae]|uniref:MbtH family NRPS accessory protein n=1 Tax=Zooshikella harenae TaxID=2827238 RepID=A0ABS5ZCT1_9GAMM|nr:MbtH family NRPS accessory protein [Zooshikella harenae]MBU2711121.1 MbtH family NRPS accessory protein [Zooshikella harenae]